MMIDRIELRDEIEHMVEHHRETMPAPIKELISQLNHDLYSGPSYYDSEGEECSCFDEGAEPFQFSYSLERVREWLDKTIEDVQVELSYNDETEESEYGRVDGTAKEIIRALVGKELASML